MNLLGPSPTSFLEVTINSSKLSQLLEDITISLRSQDRRIKSLQQQLKKSTQFLDNKIKLDRQYIQQQLQKCNAKAILVNKEANVFISSVDRHLEQFKRENQVKIQLLNQKIIKNSEACTQRANQLLGIIQKESTQRKQQLKKREKQLRLNFQTVDEQVKNFGQSTNQQFGKLKDLLFDKIGKVNQFPQYDRATQRLLKLKKNHHVQHKSLNEQNTVKYAAISAKITELQSKLKQKQNTPINKILYAKNYQKKQQNRQNLQRNDQQIATKIQQQLGSIQCFLANKLKFLFKDIQLLKAKILVLEERFAVFGRKFDRDHQGIVQIRQRVKILQQAKVNEKIIDSLRNEIERCIKRTQDMVEIKCNKDIFDKQKNKVHQKLSIIHENIIEKAQKSQVKKAILFLEDKIKDIILLIANEQNNQKEGAITRLPLKCLSCQKDIDLRKGSQRRAPQSAVRSLNNQNSLRSMSNRIKRKIRMSHNSQNSVNY